jgi:RNA polymerase sporulation-specific sigma factor
LKVFEKPLSEQEEKEMLIRSCNGDIEARNILVEKNMRLVAHMIKKYACAEKDTQDLISVGTIGLIKAVNTFNPDKKIRLATYAAKCIDNEILMMLRNDKKKMQELSLYEPIGTDKEGNDITFIDVVGDETRDDVGEMLTAEQLKCIYDNMDNILTEREKTIIIGRFGLFGSKEMTQNELAAKLNISRSYVSRIERHALNKLYALLENKKLIG